MAASPSVRQEQREQRSKLSGSQHYEENAKDLSRIADGFVSDADIYRAQYTLSRYDLRPLLLDI